MQNGGNAALGKAEAEESHPLFLDRNEPLAMANALRIAGSLVDADDTVSSEDDADGEGELEDCDQEMSNMVVAKSHGDSRRLRPRNNKILDVSTGIFHTVSKREAAANVAGGGKSSRSYRRGLEARRLSNNPLAGRGDWRRKKRNGRSEDASLGEVQVLLSMVGVDKKKSL